MPDRQRGRPQARSRSSSLKSFAPHALGSAATESHQHAIGMASEILRRQPWLSPEVLNWVARIIRKPRCALIIVNSWRVFESQIAPITPAELLCALVGATRHPDSSHPAGITAPTPSP